MVIYLTYLNFRTHHCDIYKQPPHNLEGFVGINRIMLMLCLVKFFHVASAYQAGAIQCLLLKENVSII